MSRYGKYREKTPLLIALASTSQNYDDGRPGCGAKSTNRTVRKGQVPGHPTSTGLIGTENLTRERCHIAARQIGRRATRVDSHRLGGLRTHPGNQGCQLLDR